MLPRGLLLSVALVASLESSGQAQVLSPFSDFVGLTSVELATVRAKLTYLGPSDHVISSLGFSVAPVLSDSRRFTPFHRVGYSYAVDTLSLVAFAVSEATLGAMIDSVAGLPAVTDGDVDPNGYISFSLQQSAGDVHTFESIVNQTNGQALVARLSGALVGNAEGLRKLTAFACATGLIATDPPEDVTSRTSVTSSGFRRQRGSDDYIAKVRLTNTSGTLIPAPMTFMPGLLGSNVEIVGADGVTCAIAPAGQYLTVPIDPAGLAPGEHVDILVRITNPSRVRVRMAPLVFAGSGTR